MHYSLNYTCGLEFRVMQFARVRPDPPTVAGIRGCLMTVVEAGDIDYLMGAGRKILIVGRDGGLLGDNILCLALALRC